MSYYDHATYMAFGLGKWRTEKVDNMPIMIQAVPAKGKVVSEQPSHQETRKESNLQWPWTAARALLR